MSEVDTCVTSPSLLQYLHDFAVIQRADLPSDHAPICISIDSPGTHLDNILSRAALLGDHAALYGSAVSSSVARKPVKFTDIDRQVFVENIAISSIPTVAGDVNVFANNISNALYECAESSRCTPAPRANHASNLGRWERLLEDADDARVWKAISWKGDFEASKSNKDTPSDEDFKVHFEHVLNPGNVQPLSHISTDVTMPVLDDPISPAEVECQIKKMKVDKACGPDGLTPGVLTVTCTVDFNHYHLI